MSSLIVKNAVPALLEQMEQDLEKCSREHTDLLVRSRTAVNIVKDALEQLKSVVLASEFSSREEEIRFFKEVKPKFVSQLVFHCRMHQIQCSKPVFRNRIMEEYLIRQLSRIEYFIHKHREFYQYTRDRHEHHDEAYFLRGSLDSFLSMDDYFFNADTRFSTGYDYLVSCFIAYERLGAWLTDELQGLPQHLGPRKSPGIPKLTWTGSKVALVELIYGLQTSGVFNNATADIKQLALCFEQLFNVELTGYYRTFQELRLRKKSRTVFLDQVKERLIQRMDEMDALDIGAPKSVFQVKQG
jgi:hypothetical protein